MLFVLCFFGNVVCDKLSHPSFLTPLPLCIVCDAVYKVYNNGWHGIEFSKRCER